MDRRAFITRTVGAMTVAMGTSAARSGSDVPAPRQNSADGIEQRVATVIQAFDAQGNHRTGTAVDTASAEWLADEVRRSGARPSLEKFTLSRVDPRSCHVRIGDRRIDGVPLFDAGFTGAAGVSGKLAPLGSTGEIGLAETTPFNLAEPGIEQRGQVAEARDSRHSAVILLTRGTRPGLFLLNAPAFDKPLGLPMLQVSSAEREWLTDHARRRAETTVVVHAQRTMARAFNVTAIVAGADRKLAPIVLMAPRSGWWQCSSEQGSRLACWLEAIRTVAAAGPVRGCLFVALSGHELGFLGMTAYLENRRELLARAHAWIFLGSSIGEPHQVNRIHASDDALEQWMVAALGEQRLAVNGKAPRESRARGEADVVQQSGGRFVTLACESDVYHNVADRWPEAIDVALLARYAKAVAGGVLRLAQQT